MDFWVLPKYRGNKTGHECYYALMNYIRNDSVKYFEINVSNERSHNFWTSIGFIDDGFDEWGEPLMKLNI